MNEKIYQHIFICGEMLSAYPKKVYCTLRQGAALASRR